MERIDWARIEQYHQLDEPGQPPLLEGLLALVKRGFPERVRNMRTMIESNDSNGLKKEAHALKNSAANLGASVMARICQDIEGNGSSDPAVLDRLAEEFAFVQKELERYLNEQKNSVK